MDNSLSILFYIKKSKADSLGKCNIYLRITIDGKRAEASIKRKIHHSRWLGKSGIAKGTSAEVNELNNYITKIRTKILTIHQSYID